MANDDNHRDGDNVHRHSFCKVLPDERSLLLPNLLQKLFVYDSLLVQRFLQVIVLRLEFLQFFRVDIHGFHCFAQLDVRHLF